MAHVYFEIFGHVLLFLSALVRHTIYIYIHTDFLDGSLLHVIMYCLCYAFIQYNCDLMYEFAQHMTHGFHIFFLKQA